MPNADQSTCRVPFMVVSTIATNSKRCLHGKHTQILPAHPNKRLTKEIPRFDLVGQVKKTKLRAEIANGRLVAVTEAELGGAPGGEEPIWRATPLLSPSFRCPPLKPLLGGHETPPWTLKVHRQQKKARETTDNQKESPSKRKLPS